jgi:hypothetical protein
MNKNANASIKSKGLHPIPQTDTITIHLPLPKRTAKTFYTLTSKN